MIDINILPFELLEKILLYTNGLTLLKCRLLSKQWNEFIVENETLWRDMCKREFPMSSRIAKRKCGNEITHFQTYRNLKMWCNFSSCHKTLRKFYNFSMHDNNHALEIDYSVLPVKEAKGIILYDMSTLKYIPVALPVKNCLKMSNNEFVTVIQVKSGIYVQRSINGQKVTSEVFLKVDKYVLLTCFLYYFINRDIYKVDLKSPDLNPDLILHSDYDLREIQYSENTLHVFTDCGKILNIDNNKTITVKRINCPEEWIRRIKHICPLDDQNFICYSRNLFHIETENYKHIYLDFPPITALFFYGDIVLIGTRAGEILLYRMSSQKKATKPIFEKVAVLPEQKFAVSLDIYERSKGPLIVAATFLELFILDVSFFPEDQLKPTVRDSSHKIAMYKRLLKLKEKLKST